MVSNLPHSKWEISREEFDGMARGRGPCYGFHHTHPQFIGRACRVNALGELIAYMKSRGAWIATNDAVARWVLQSKGFALPAHESSVFPECPALLYSRSISRYLS